MFALNLQCVQGMGCNVNRSNNSDSSQPLLTEAAFRALLGGMSERKFKQLRADGIVGAPLLLGPRVSRWTHADYQDTLARLPRRQKAPEPDTLASARRARIEAMKRQPRGGVR